MRIALTAPCALLLGNLIYAALSPGVVGSGIQLRCGKFSAGSERHRRASGFAHCGRWKGDYAARRMSGAPFFLEGMKDEAEAF